MAVTLNEYFLSVFSKESDGPVPSMNKLPSTSVLSDITISSFKVKKKIEELKPNSAPGPDNITPRFLKLNAEAMSTALAVIFNKSLQTGCT